MLVSVSGGELLVSGFSMSKSLSCISMSVIGENEPVSMIPVSTGGIADTVDNDGIFSMKELILGTCRGLLYGMFTNGTVVSDIVVVVVLRCVFACLDEDT